MVRPLSRNVVGLFVCFWLASTGIVGSPTPASAEPVAPEPDPTPTPVAPGPDAAPEPEPPPTLAHGFVNDLEDHVQRLLPSVAGTLDNLHVKGRAIEFRQPLAWEGRALELRVRGGRFKGQGRGAARGYGLRVELRF